MLMLDAVSDLSQETQTVTGSQAFGISVPMSEKVAVGQVVNRL
jgi:hypothetical protein